MINVYIADDHPLIREGFKKIIRGEIDMNIVGEAENGDEVIRNIGDKNADILLLDLKMPGKSGIPLIDELKSLYPDLLILVVTMLSQNHYAARTLKAGANGFLNKTVAVKELVKAIRSIISRGKYISPEIADLLYEEIEKEYVDSPHKNLSEREFQIMCLIAEGEKVRDIASRLSISISTVNTYRSRIMRKMGMKTNVELTRYVMENRLLQ
jgi:DNA-binding NarL/FixJ family response regulator